ncbi:MAG: flavin-containing monooxygenase [Pseudooceanicola sp.]
MMIRPHYERSHPADRIEVGNLLRTQAATFSDSVREQPMECHDTIVVGGGQAGLSVGHHLKRAGREFVILEGSRRIGDVWRHRWDSLRLFTPAKFDGLDGFPFPAARDHFPTKDEMADYLECYADRFDLPLRLGQAVERLSCQDDRFVVETSRGTFAAKHVVVAAAGYRRPKIPEMARDLPSDVFQMHSRDYRRPGQVPPGCVLLVGAGNSGAEIAMDLAPTHDVVLAGRATGHIPFDISGFWGRKLLVRVVVRGLFHHILTLRTPMGRKFRAKMHGKGMPLIRTRPGALERAGVTRIGRIERIAGSTALSEDGTETTFDSVIWCTGYHPGLDWIDLPVFDQDGAPRHRFGKSVNIDGLYFAGLPFQYAVSSTMVAGVGRDARRVAAWIDAAPA